MKDVIEVNNLEEFYQIIESSNKDTITVTNPSGSIFYMGLPYIEQLIKLAKDNYPSKDIEFILNCEDEASMVIEAMSMGFKKIKFTGNKELASKLRSIAKQKNAELITS